MASAPRLLPGPFTVEMYQRLGALGVFPEDDRVELINGQVVPMSPIGESHASCVRRLIRLLSRRVGERAIVDAQNPVVLGEADSPQPDIALLRFRTDGYRRHPRPNEILLVIEVADTSLAYDRDLKLPRYARAGIAEVWLVDLSGDRISAYRDPAADGYRTLLTVGRRETLQPLLLSDVALTADEILG